LNPVTPPTVSASTVPERIKAAAPRVGISAAVPGNEVSAVKKKLA